ncbi:hypothetical protein [Sphingomonas sp.]|uniref:hypothetical protein n=1 Tax=Sphingomonas sp. TaxID=28214 RepID=UPI003D6D6DB9
MSLAIGAFLVLLPDLFAGVAGWKSGVWQKRNIALLVGIAVLLSFPLMLRMTGLYDAFIFVLVFTTRLALMFVSYWLGCALKRYQIRVHHRPS